MWAGLAKRSQVRVGVSEVIDSEGGAGDKQEPCLSLDGCLGDEGAGPGLFMGFSTTVTGLRRCACASCPGGEG